jgi:peptidyl-tRNA hydrolase, PTH1 family
VSGVFGDGSVKLVVGLGNPGRRYERTRHNLGFLVVDHIAAEKAVIVKKRLGDALVGEWSNGERILLAKPQSYMNRSGDSVKELLREFGASAKDLVIVYDDLDLPFGRIRIRPEGGAGGHRGVLSVMESLEGAPFYRVRVGIGRPPEGVEPTDYVLEGFSPEEATEVNDVVSRASDAVICLLQEGAQRAMERFNRAP